VWLHVEDALDSGAPVLAWNDWYHCMGNTYGTWLPGEAPRISDPIGT
jgi:hypothetical protein